MNRTAGNAWKASKLGTAALLSAAILSAQPLVYEGGIVNAASYGMGERERNHVAPGSIAAIFGERLADVTLQAQSVPLPFELGGVRVTVGGLPAPIFFVSPTQINIQIPRDTRIPLPISDVPSVNASVIVTNRSGTSAARTVQVAVQAPGIFTLNGTGCGAPAILNVEDDGSVSVNGPDNPAPPGSYVTIFGTGLGWPSRQPDSLDPDGMPARAIVNAEQTDGLRTLITFMGESRSGRPIFAGRAPGLVGVDQWNLRVPEGNPPGCNHAISLRNTAWRHQSQWAHLSVGARGQRCQDPSLQSGAEITWKRRIIHSRDGSIRQQEFLDIRIARQRYPGGYIRWEWFGKQFVDFFFFSNGSTAVLGDIEWESQCPGFRDMGLDAGTISVSGSLGNWEVRPVAMDGSGTRYSLPLPAGTLKAGSVTVRASGGRDVGPFETTLTLSEPVKLITPMDQGKPLCTHDVRFTVDAPADSEDIIRGYVIGGGYAYDIIGPARARDLRFYWGPERPVSLPGLGPPRWLRVFQEPWEKNVHEFTASGLTAGGRHGWKYEWRWESVETGCPAQ